MILSRTLVRKESEERLGVWRKQQRSGAHWDERQRRSQRGDTRRGSQLQCQVV